MENSVINRWHQGKKNVLKKIVLLAANGQSKMINEISLKEWENTVISLFQMSSKKISMEKSTMLETLKDSKISFEIFEAEITQILKKAKS